MPTHQYQAEEKLLVIVELNSEDNSGSITNITAPDNVEVWVVDWEALTDAGIACPRCGDDSLYAAGDAKDTFICNGCGYIFEFHLPLQRGSEEPEELDLMASGYDANCTYCGDLIHLIELPGEDEEFECPNCHQRYHAGEHYHAYP